MWKSGENGDCFEPGMGLIRIIVVLLLAAAIFGGAGWLGYRLYLEPKMAMEAERQAATRETEAQAAAPDPVETEFAAVSSQASTAAPAAAREMWAGFLAKHPDSPRAAEVRALLGPLNMQALFAPGGEATQSTHTVAGGDSLYRVAKVNKTTIELIARANNLTNTMLRIGAMNMLLHGISTADLNNKDTLAKPYARRAESCVALTTSSPIHRFHFPGVRPTKIRTASPARQPSSATRDSSTARCRWMQRSLTLCSSSTWSGNDTIRSKQS